MKMNEKGKVTVTEESSSNSSDWAELTRECLINVLSRLSFEERWIRAMLVCKPWLQASKDPSLNTVFNLDPYFDSSPDSARLWTPEFESKIDSMLRSVAVCSDGDLKEIRVRHCSDRVLEFAVQRSPRLEVLSVKSSQSVTNAGISAVALNCPQLKELDISYCHEISHESLLLIGRSCPNLSVLKRNFMNWLDPSQHTGIVPDEYLKGSPQDGDSEAAAVAETMPQLVHLELQFCKLTAKGLVLISEGCQKLEFMDLSGCGNLTSREVVNACVKLKGLKTVKKPNFFIPRSVYHTQRYGHWNLYDERFQTDIFRI
ncbi:hypothetical protein V2J09_002192 [Rumex salicifolius]